MSTTSASPLMLLLLLLFATSAAVLLSAAAAAGASVHSRTAATTFFPTRTLFEGEGPKGGPKGGESHGNGKDSYGAAGAERVFVLPQGMRTPHCADSAATGVFGGAFRCEPTLQSAMRNVRDGQVLVLLGGNYKQVPAVAGDGAITVRAYDPFGADSDFDGRVLRLVPHAARPLRAAPRATPKENAPVPQGPLSGAAAAHEAGTVVVVDLVRPEFATEKRNAPAANFGAHAIDAGYVTLRSLPLIGDAARRRRAVSVRTTWLPPLARRQQQQRRGTVSAAVIVGNSSHRLSPKTTIPSPTPMPTPQQIDPYGPYSNVPPPSSPPPSTPTPTPTPPGDDSSTVPVIITLLVLLSLASCAIFLFAMRPRRRRRRTPPAVGHFKVSPEGSGITQPLLAPLPQAASAPPLETPRTPGEPESSSPTTQEASAVQAAQHLVRRRVAGGGVREPGATSASGVANGRPFASGQFFTSRQYSPSAQ